MPPTAAPAEPDTASPAATSVRPADDAAPTGAAAAVLDPIDTDAAIASPEAAQDVHYPRQLNRGIKLPRAAKLSVGHLLLGGFVAALAVWATWWAWVDAWRLVDASGDNSHVLMVPIVAIALAWVRRERMPHVRVTGRYIGVLGILAGWTLLVNGETYSVLALYHLGALLIALGGAVTICGKGLIFRFMPVIGSLLFLVPVPGEWRQALAVPLQQVTAQITAKVLLLCGIDANVAGNTLMVKEQMVRIADACNGMPMAFGLLLVTYAFVFAWPLRNSVRWGLLLLTPVVTLVCNVLRTTPLTWAYAFHSQELGDQLHAILGWLMLPAAFVMLVLIVRLMKWFDLRVERYRLAVS